MNRRQRRAQGQGKSKTVRPAAPDPAALHEAGVQAFRAGELAAAAALIGQAIAAGGPMPEMHYNLGIVLKAMGRLQEAAASYERAIALKPDHVNAHNNLGNVWKALGHAEQAKASFAEALRHNPGNADTHYNLGILCCDAGQQREAERHFRHALECDPSDARGAAILLAHLGAAAAPDRTPPAHLRNLYDIRARFWDGEESYFGAALVAQALRRHASGARRDLLDIGCGTGQVGMLVRDLAERLDGVDLSPAMLAKAEAKDVYDRLVEADLAAFMAAHRCAYDAILGAAALIHFGDLTALFEAAAACLRRGGLFVFTVFPHASEPDAGTDYAVAANSRLAQSGCFRHSTAYLERLASQAGFSVLELEDAVHERDQDGKPVPGIVAVLRRN